MPKTEKSARKAIPGALNDIAIVFADNDFILLRCDRNHGHQCNQSFSNVVKSTKFQHRLNFRNLMGLNARQERRDVLILWFLLCNCCFAIDRMLSGAYVLTINRAMIASGFGDDKDGCGVFLARIFRSDKHGLPNRAP
ncbi:hypothetical protein [Thalassospira lohafexi]|uniref:hypothetical protein n=1 Tax=Thalassospira lohafexi TaxID=744227 RepID=UPI0010560606|nr:hypothetical protein [Thalassospira lohafexi]